MSKSTTGRKLLDDLEKRVDQLERDMRTYAREIEDSLRVTRITKDIDDTGTPIFGPTKTDLKGNLPDA